jgi:hypothetical protein
LQSDEAVQLVLQALAEQMNWLGQVWGAGGTHAPALQELCPTKLVPEHVGPLPQETVGNTQALELLQVPAQVAPPDPTQSELAQHPEEATQTPADAHFLGREPPQVKPHDVPSHVAVPPVGVGQAEHEVPHDPVLVLDAQLFPQGW